MVAYEDFKISELLDEVYYLARSGFQYSEILNMPVSHRRYFIQKLIEEHKRLQRETGK